MDNEEPVYIAGVTAPPAARSPAAAPSAASDDLLQLQGNPFANMLNGESLTRVVAWEGL